MWNIKRDIKCGDFPPNLPDKKIEYVLVSKIIPANICDELKKLNVECIKLGRAFSIPNEVAYHPDILVCNYASGRWITSGGAYICDGVHTSFTFSRMNVSSVYPNDCLYNCFAVGNVLYGGTSICPEILEYVHENSMGRVIFRQGYAKCSTVIVNENSFITSDAGICKNLTARGKNCLLVNNSDIGLNDLSYGFIGGCAGKIANNILVFTGDLSKHSYGADIISFCKNVGVDAVSLANEPLYDYGGILPYC